MNKIKNPGITLMTASSGAFLVISLIVWIGAIRDYGESPWLSGFIIGLFYGMIPLAITIATLSFPLAGSVIAIGVSLLACVYWIIKAVAGAGSTGQLWVVGGLACSMVFLAGGLLKLARIIKSH